jgi:hypothetical protein
MKQRALAAVLVAVLGAGATAPALADGAASTRNIILFGAAATVFTANYVKKTRQKRQEQKEVNRRQDAYRDWFYHKYGYYPTYDQFKQWYVQTYNTNPD